MTRIYLRSAGFCLLVIYLVITGIHSFNVPEDVREADWAYNPEGDR